MTLYNISNKIYVLNLKTRTDRREHIINQLNKINCNNYTIIESIDGKELVNTTKLSNGMLGLNHTYLKIYDEWSKESNNNIIIIEDDCVFFENFNDELLNYITNVPNDWDMLYFGGNHNYHVGSKTEKINEYCLKLNNTYTAHCVVLKNYVFKELIDNLKNMEIENDVLLSRLQKKYNAYSTIKNITTQLPNFSNIENINVDYKNLIK
jgi:GR25 family glycosyltransferase involved in LPS biosynthesis